MLSAVLACVAFAHGAAANDVCGEDKIIREVLERQNGEHLVLYGRLTSRSSLLALMVSPDTRTWTLIENMPSEQTCIRARGTDFFSPFVFPDDEEQ